MLVTSNENKECTICKGNTYVTMKMKDLSGRQLHSCGILRICVCPNCLGKGFTTKNDNKRIKSVEPFYQIVE